jgi:flagellar biogenesis protein FliO
MENGETEQVTLPLFFVLFQTSAATILGLVLLLIFIWSLRKIQDGRSSTVRSLLVNGQPVSCSDACAFKKRILLPLL